MEEKKSLDELRAEHERRKRRGHDTYGKIPYCSACNKNFPTKEAVKAHYKEQHGVKVLACNICQMTFSNERQLTGHRQKMHKQAIQVCKDCGLQFKGKDALNKHRVAAHDAHKYYCDTCDDTFPSEATLETHQKSHTEPKLPTCHICKNIFSTKHEVDICIQSHSDDNPFKCEYCYKVFTSKRQIYMHIKRCHETNKDYACITCGRSFVDNWKLKKHEEVHEKQKARSKILESKKQKGVIRITPQQIQEAKTAKTTHALTKNPDKVKKRTVTATVTKPVVEKKTYGFADSNNPVVIVPNSFPTPKPHEFVVVKKKGEKTFQVVNIQREGQVQPPPLLPNNLTGVPSTVFPSAFPTYVVGSQTMLNQQPFLMNSMANLCQTSVSTLLLPTYTIQTQNLNSQNNPTVQPQPNPTVWKDLEMEGVVPKFLTAEGTIAEKKTCKIKSTSEALEAKGSSYDGLQEWLKGTKRKLRPDVDMNSKKREPEEESENQRLSKLDKVDDEGNFEDMGTLPFETDIPEINPKGIDTTRVKTENVKHTETQNKTMGPLFFCSQCQKEFLTINELSIHEESHLLPLQRLQLPLPGTVATTGMAATEKQLKIPLPGPLINPNTLSNATLMPLGVPLKHPTSQLPPILPTVQQVFMINQPQIVNVQRNDATDNGVAKTAGQQRQPTILEGLLRNTETHHLMACPGCSLYFQGAKALENHLKLSSWCRPKTPTICKVQTVCDVMKQKTVAGPSEKQNDSDLMSKDSDDRLKGDQPVFCNICREEFADPCILGLHMNVHSVIGENLLVQKPVQAVDKCGFSCIMCEKVFINQQSLTKHVEDHCNKFWLTCSDCDIVFHGLTELREHKKTCGKTANNQIIGENKQHSPSKCSICGKTYSDNGEKEAHMQFHEKVHALTCPTCGQRFDTASLLNIHMELMNHTSAEIFWCDVCRQVIHDIGGLEPHMQQHENQEVKEPTETCEVCGGHFDDLKAHILEEHKVPKEIAETHTCTTCGDRFDTSGMLEIHKQIMKHETQEKVATESDIQIKTENDPPIKTEDDPQIETQDSPKIKMENDSSSDIHLSGTNSESSEPEHLKPFSCSECDAVFSNSGALRLHMRDHPLDSKLTCKVCSKSVIDLKAHMLTHKDDLPFKCDVCGKGFLHKSRMDFHMRMHTS